MRYYSTREEAEQIATKKTATKAAEVKTYYEDGNTETKVLQAVEALQHAQKQLSELAAYGIEVIGARIPVSDAMTGLGPVAVHVFKGIEEVPGIADVRKREDGCREYSKMIAGIDFYYLPIEDIMRIKAVKQSA